MGSVENLARSQRVACTEGSWANPTTTSRPSLLSVWICVLAACCVATGCRESHSPVDVTDAPFVRVTYQGEPLGDVQVRLHERVGGPVLAQSISRQDGNAYFPRVPSPEPAKYFVTVESLGDGGWILDAKACQTVAESVSLQTLESSPGQRIEIPDGAVQPLKAPKVRL